VQLGLSHQMLCAKHLTFPHPISGKTMHLSSKMDATFP